MNLSNLLATSGLPPSGQPAGQELLWLYHDNIENYRRQGGHQIYGENDITYRFNSLGYRCPEFDAVADIRILAIGCSYVLGMALPQQAIFHELFAERLRVEMAPKTVVVWNLGLSGASNDYISRLLYLAVPRLDPQIVLVNFTHSGRREYVSAQNRHVNYTPSFEPSDQTTKDVFRHFAALSSPFDDQLHFFKNYKAVEHLLVDYQWLYSAVKPQDFESISAHMDLDRYVGQLQYFDRARDNGHPGPECHRLLAELYWAKFIELGGLAELG